LLRGVIQTNDEQYERVAQKVIELCGGSVKDKVVAVWGLTFKANTDDLRDSPSIAILTVLHQMGARVKAFEPSAKTPYVAFPWIEICSSALDVCEGADVLAVLTEWPEFSQVVPEEVGERLLNKSVVDGRNILDREEWLSNGFVYRGIGR
jgi:UDPglucose 6-dehydrogenase